jgi:hypothetical protein
MVDYYGFSFIILCLFSVENQQSAAAEHSTDTKHKEKISKIQDVVNPLLPSSHHQGSHQNN